MNRNLRLGATFVLVCFVALFGFYSGGRVTSLILQHVQLDATEAFGASAPSTPGKGKGDAKTNESDRYKNLELFQKVLFFVQNNYVEDVKMDKLVQGAIKGMLETLDPHSTFLSQEVFKEMKVDTSGKFGGLGIEIGMKEGVLTVVAPIEDTPAWKAGLKPDDKIIKINGESTKGLSLVEAVNKMRGKPNTKVVLTIYRQGFEEFKDVAVMRDIIKIRSVKFEKLEDGYGYVRLTQFNETAASDVEKAIAKLEDGSKLKGLIFDMRGNPGGLLEQAVDVTSLFIDEGIVVSTIPRDKGQKEVKYAKKGKARKDLPVAVLVSSNSASASEIVAGALQDHKRAVILGQPTFGKASVQTVIELGNEMGLKLTIARYYTPSGKSLQEKGITPDILLDEFNPKLLAKAKVKREAFREKDLKGHIVNEDDMAESAAASSSSSSSSKKEDFSVDEVKAGKKPSKKSSEDSADGDDDMAPLKFEPKEDFQVKQAVNYLKSASIFQRISAPTADTPVRK